MKQSTTAKAALLLTAMLWGSTFTIGKLAAEVFSASFIIALRFLIAAAALLIVAFTFFYSSISFDPKQQAEQLQQPFWHF